MSELPPDQRRSGPPDPHTKKCAFLGLGRGCVLGQVDPGETLECGRPVQVGGEEKICSAVAVAGDPPEIHLQPGAPCLVLIAGGARDAAQIIQNLSGEQP